MAISTDPFKCSFNNPGLRKNDELFGVKPINISIFQQPIAAKVFAIFGPRYPISANIYNIKGKRRRASLSNHFVPSQSSLIVWQDSYVEQEVERVDKDMTLVTRDLLASV